MPTMPEQQFLSTCTLDDMKRRQRECTQAALEIRAEDYVDKARPMPDCGVKQCEAFDWRDATAYTLEVEAARKAVRQ
jgi:hypothetical protein